MEKHEEIEEEFLQHFKQVHREPETNRNLAIDKIIKKIPKIITYEHSEILLRPILPQEVEAAMH